MNNKNENRITDNNTCLSLEIIKDYYDGKLSEKDMRKVEEHIIDCPFCSDAFDGYEFANKKNLANDINEINSQIDKKIERRNGWKTILLSSAALIALFTFSILLNSQNNNELIFSEHFKPYPDVTLQTRGIDSLNSFKEAMQLYNLQKYSEAINKFNLLKNKKDDYRIDFYNGVANIAIGNYQTGIDLLNKIANNNSNDFFAEANWYKALAQLKLNKVNEAKESFSLIENNSDYKSEIRKIKMELKNDE